MKTKKKPHAVCIPLPAQGHINPMLKLAKLLHSKGFFITFVHTESTHKHILNNYSSSSVDTLKGSDDFEFEKLSDGYSDHQQGNERKRDIDFLESFCRVMPEHGLPSFRELIMKINGNWDVPDVSCIVSDCVVSFTLDVGLEFGIPVFMLFPLSASAILGYLQFHELQTRGYFPLKDSSCLTNGYLDTEVDWIPAMKGIRLKDLPTSIRTTDPNDAVFNFNLQTMSNSMKAKGIILNTFDELEQEILFAINSKFPNQYTIGPLTKLHQHLCSSNLQSNIQSNLWKEDTNCLSWLEQREFKSVLYINFGSLITMSEEDLREFAWGIANSKCPFLWVVRPDLLEFGENNNIISNDFMDEIKGRGVLVGWCPQEKVLGHFAIGGFLTHCGWNSTIESISEGVALICWPCFADQQTNCAFSCRNWGIGIEIDGDVKREKVEWAVKELMGGNRGKEIREKAIEWKKKVEVAIKFGGTSYNNFERLVNDLINDMI